MCRQVGEEFEKRTRARVVKAMTLTEAAVVIQSAAKRKSQRRQERSSRASERAAHWKPTNTNALSLSASDVLGPQYAMLSGMRSSLTSSAVGLVGHVAIDRLENTLEKVTGLDLDGDGDVGVVGHAKHDVASHATGQIADAVSQVAPGPASKAEEQAVEQAEEQTAEKTQTVGQAVGQATLLRAAQLQV